MNQIPSHSDFDVIVVGGGPAGSTLGRNLALEGRSVLIVDKVPFPRHRIGESLTGECGKLLREMGFSDVMTENKFPIKRGVKVSGPNAATSFYVPILDWNDEGKLEPRSTWQVSRPEFDQMLLGAATKEGCEYLLADARNVIRDGTRVTGLSIKMADGTTRDFSCRVVADASGQSTFLSKRGVVGQRQANRYDKQVAFFAQFENAERDAEPVDGDTVLFYSERHNWSWFIPISDTVTSVGTVQPSSVFKDSGLAPEEFFKHQLKTLHPDLARRMSSATMVSEVWKMSNYSYEISDFAGEGFICVGDAHRFLDPIFSFGVYMGMKEARLASLAISEALNDQSSEEKAFGRYRELSDKAQQVVQDIINTFWEFPLAFLKLAHYSHKDDIAELFAGRMFDENVRSLEAVKLMRGLLAGKGM